MDGIFTNRPLLLLKERCRVAICQMIRTTIITKQEFKTSSSEEEFSLDAVRKKMRQNNNKRTIQCPLHRYKKIAGQCCTSAAFLLKQLAGCQYDLQPPPHKNGNG
mmetsp:Transcript_2112/g.2913  ORF Transcript_2112/g.2913 Transcript_2112/m.2913 type:complete len:105 (+) Transcript_2112:612-926(+)